MAAEDIIFSANLKLEVLSKCSISLSTEGKRKRGDHLVSLVSVLLPVYNGASHVRSAIESVLAQEYENFEFVIIDNASNDGTAEIINEYLSDNRVRVIRNKETVPRLENFKLAFDSASKESCWYKFIGDDDLLLPGCLAEMVEAGEKLDNIGLVGSYYYKGAELVKGAIEEGKKIVKGDQILKIMLLQPETRSTIFSPTSVLIVPEAYHSMSGFRTDLLHADAELFYRILNRYNLAYVHKPLTEIGYHSASGQALSTLSGDTFTEAYLIRYLNLKHYDRIKFTRLEVEKIKYNLAADSVGYMLARIARGDIKAACNHLIKIPLAAIYHLPLAFAYFTGLALRKLLRREPIRLFGRNKR